jgi:hypothetical protein
MQGCEGSVVETQALDGGIGACLWGRPISDLWLCKGSGLGLGVNERRGVAGVFKQHGGMCSGHTLQDKATCAGSVAACRSQLSA